MTKQRLPSRGKVVLIALLPIAFLTLGIMDLSDTIALHRSNKVVDARITEHRIMSTRFGLSHEVKYIFSEGPNSPPIGRMGFLGDSLWSTLPETEWRKAVESGYLSVKCDPSKVGNNA